MRMLIGALRLVTGNLREPPLLEVISMDRLVVSVLIEALERPRCGLAVKTCAEVSTVVSAEILVISEKF